MLKWITGEIEKLQTIQNVSVVWEKKCRQKVLIQSSAFNTQIAEACAFDLCMVSQNTEDDILEISEWLNGPVRAYALRLIQEEITEAGKSNSPSVY